MRCGQDEPHWTMIKQTIEAAYFINLGLQFLEKLQQRLKPEEGCFLRIMSWSGREHSKLWTSDPSALKPLLRSPLFSGYRWAVGVMSEEKNDFLSLSVDELSDHSLQLKVWLCRQAEAWMERITGVVGTDVKVLSFETLFRTSQWACLPYDPEIFHCFMSICSQRYH